MISKLTGAFASLLLLLAAATTASSQEQPKAIDLNALAARGEAIANANSLSAELRNRRPDDPARRGFDIGHCVGARWPILTGSLDHRS
jgi:hypothetical protein